MTSRFRRRMQSCLIAGTVTATTQVGAMTLYQGGDDAGPGEARPNADAAQLAFANTLNVRSMTPASIDFESLPLTDVANLTVAPGVTAAWSGHSTDFGGTIREQQIQQFGYNTTFGGKKHVHLDPDSDDARLVFSFDEPIHAWGAYITGVGSMAGTISVMIDDGVHQWFDLTGVSDGAVKFLGAMDFARPVIEIVIASLNGDDSVGVDDMQFAAAAHVPAPATLTLLGLGLAGISYRRRRP